MAKSKKTAAPAAGAESLQAATEVLATTLAAALSKPAVELKVGIRNISDNTIGVKSPFKDEQDLDLHGDTLPPNENPGRYAVISYAWWQQLRKSKLMERGEIMRDDSVLGSNYAAAPADAPHDIPASWAMNAIIDPIAWVAGFKGDDDGLRLAIEKITNDTSLRRVRRVVDMKLKELEKSFGVDPQRAKKALQALPSTYQMMDQVITMKLERPDEE
jgi:hypothetical protein